MAEIPSREECQARAAALLEQADGRNPDWATARAVQASAWLMLSLQLPLTQEEPDAG